MNLPHHQDQKSPLYNPNLARENQQLKSDWWVYASGKTTRKKLGASPKFSVEDDDEDQADDKPDNLTDCPSF